MDHFPGGPYMKICFLGYSHAAQHLSAAAAGKGFDLVGIDADPALVFVSQDTPTDESGHRFVTTIRTLTYTALEVKDVPVVITSQVEPGFTRDFNNPRLYHQAETLRIKDAAHRASHPEQMIVGCLDPAEPLPPDYETYLKAFDCPILTMTYESAEFSKMAINAFLISQVETTNMLSRIAKKCGADWADVRRALRLDARIGPQAYLEPGRWQDSRHLLRDYVSLVGLGDNFVYEHLLDALNP